MSERDRIIEQARKNAEAAKLADALGFQKFYERIGRLRQASDTWFGPRLTADLEILINLAEKYRELSNRAVEAERKG